MYEILIKQIGDFIKKYEHSPYISYTPGDEKVKTTYYGRKGRQLKPYLKYGGRLIPREEVERKKTGLK